MYQYYICDVFTDQRFGGNPLAVFTQATGLSDANMQNIAKELNFSETSFVFPTENAHTCQVRIFTPKREIPFAGHPNIGTAYVLKKMGLMGGKDNIEQFVFEEKAGLIAISVSQNNDGLLFELKAPQALSIGQNVPLDLIEQSLSLDRESICTQIHKPQVASVGLPFIFVQLNSHQALHDVKVNVAAFEQIQQSGISADMHVYWLDPSNERLFARVFVPLDNIPEDPATGSANCALAGLLTHYDPCTDGSFKWQVYQGIEMGRASMLQVRASKRHNNVDSCWVAGTCVMVAKGQLTLDDF